MSTSHGFPDSFSSFNPLNVSSQTEQYELEKSPHVVPESNNRAVISALLGLQQKIRQLEEERTQAEQNLNSLSNETAHYRDLVKRQQPVKQTTEIPSLRHSKELRDQLASAESRSQLLEKQLEHMRNIVHNVEHDRESGERQQELQFLQERQIANDQIKAQKEKLGELQKEHSELKATQVRAESKIEDLQNKVREEKHQREKLQSKADSLQTMIKSKEVLRPSSPTHKPKRTKKKRRPQATSTKVPSEHLPSHAYKQPCTTTRHLRLKMDNVPFVAGKSTAPSHNVNVNMQNLIALMKTHNPAWCGNAATSQNQPHNKKTKTRKASLSSTTSSDSDLGDLLLGLQDEFGQLAFEHQEITKKIQETTHPRLQEDLEQELGLLIKRMEAKGDQINKLKKHRRKIVKKGASSMDRRPQSSIDHQRESEVKVITTVKTKGKGMMSTKVVTPDLKTSPRMLHQLKSLQTTLRKDDVSWD